VPARIALGAVVLSLALHGAFLLGLSGVSFLRVETPVPIEVLPMKKRPPAPPVLDPPKPRPRPQTKPGPTAKPKTAAAPSKGPERPPPPPAEDLRAIGPSGANVTIILRGPLLAKSPHRDGVDQLLSILPDYHTLLDGTGLHPFDDLEALLIATPDPRDVSATFLAARHRGDPRLGQLTERRLGGGDPRQFRALGTDLMLLGRPEDLLRIERAEANAANEVAPNSELAEAARWLTALRQFDQGGKEAAFQLTISDLALLVRIPGGALPLPRTIRLAMSAEASPRVRLLCVFDEEAQAIQFAGTWPEVRVRLRESAPMFAGALDDLKLSRKEKEVELAGSLPEARVRLALSLAQLLAPRRATSPALPPPPAPTPVPEGAPAQVDPE